MKAFFVLLVLTVFTVSSARYVWVEDSHKEAKTENNAVKRLLSLLKKRLERRDDSCTAEDDECEDDDECCGDLECIPGEGLFRIFTCKEKWCSSMQQCSDDDDCCDGWSCKEEQGLFGSDWYCAED